MTNHAQETNPQNPPRWNAVSMTAIVLLRMVIGWYFLYEGMVKLLDPNWSSYGYLVNARWLGADWFHSIAANANALQIVDLINIWGLLLIGLGLFFGCLSRLASLSGVVLLVLYYAANPSLINAMHRVGAEGNSMIFDKNLLVLFALVVLTCVPSGRYLGVDGFVAALWRKWTAKKPVGTDAGQAASRAVGRRELLKHLATIPAFGGFVYAYQKRHGWQSFEVNNLLARDKDAEADGKSGATIKQFEFAKLDELKGTVPHAKIGNLEVSRMILGGNLVGGWAHSRDLVYVSKLVLAYHSDQKVFETFRIAEQCGINTFLTNPQLYRVINDYWKKEGGKIQFFSDCAIKGDPIEGIKMSIDGGAHSCYVQGGISDNLVKSGNLDPIAKSLDLIRQNGLPAGIGAHRLETVQACVNAGLKPDYWMKTLHEINYWSAQIQPQNDNIWCEDPAACTAYMEQLEEPWIAFKILAAGALMPNVAFPYAFKSGADFICVGMYDFQVIENANLAIDVLNNVTDRKRPWCSQTITVA